MNLTTLYLKNPNMFKSHLQREGVEILERTPLTMKLELEDGSEMTLDFSDPEIILRSYEGSTEEFLYEELEKAIFRE